MKGDFGVGPPFCGSQPNLGEHSGSLRARLPCVASVSDNQRVAGAQVAIKIPQRFLHAECAILPGESVQLNCIAVLTSWTKNGPKRKKALG